MALKIGLVGLPNAGKSSLFNLVTGASVPAENYPFNTIDPNIGVVAVADERVEKISQLLKPDKTNYAQVQYYDIAGLVKGAASGEGLGNQFLANIREVDAIVLVLRNFNDSNVEHVLGRVNPDEDREVLLTELRLKDLETVTKSREKLSRTRKTQDENVEQKIHLIDRLIELLDLEKNASELELDNNDDIVAFYKSLQLLTSKPYITLLNGPEYDRTQEGQLSFDIGVAQELAGMDPASAAEMASDLGVEFNGVEALTEKAFAVLGYIVYITAGKQEVRSWAIPASATAREAAGVIHTDFSAKFIAAEITSADQFIECGSWQGVKEAGYLRLESGDYVMRDGDVANFRIGA